jgi:hypothetical protein
MRFYQYCELYIEHKQQEQRAAERSRRPASRRTEDKKPVGMTNPKPN